MKVTTKGQVTIPIEIREKLGIDSNSEVEFIEKNGKVYLEKKKGSGSKSHGLRSLVGVSKSRMSTEEILALTRA